MKKNTLSPVQLIVSYLLFLGILFVIFYNDMSFVSRWINEPQKDLIVSLLGLGLENQMQGDAIIIHQRYHLIVTHACNGIIPLMLYGAMVLAYPRQIRHKILWLIIGYIVLTIVNVLRIFLVVYLVKVNHKSFSLVHDWGGNFIFMITILSLLFLFIKTSKANQKED